MADADSTPEVKAQWAAYMREYGRKKGAIPVKGVFITCVRCGVSTEKQHSLHDWCADCVKPAQLERRRQVRAEQGATPIGSQLQCKNCGTGFVKEHKRQFYCAACMVLAAKDGIPAYRSRQSQYQAARNKEKRSTDESFAIRERMSAQVCGALRGLKAGRRWESIVGYRLADLMTHLERQFLDGMKWDNRADWHIDHIVPLATFKFDGADDPEIRAAWALSNLRPIWASDNIRKSDSRTYLL